MSSSKSPVSGKTISILIAIIAFLVPFLVDIPGLDDPQRRILAATVGGVRIVNLYVVNGSEVGSEKFAYKLHWLEKVTEWLDGEREEHENLVVLGDFNIAPDDRDVYDPEGWREKILCSTPEREALRRILDLGLRDTFRLFLKFTQQRLHKPPSALVFEEIDAPLIVAFLDHLEQHKAADTVIKPSTGDNRIGARKGSKHCTHITHCNL